MTYLEISEQLGDPVFRQRANVCVREQGQIFASDPRADVAELGRSVTGGSAASIDAVINATGTFPGASELDTDAGLLSAVQAVFPEVGAALFGGA